MIPAQGGHSEPLRASTTFSRPPSQAIGVTMTPEQIGAYTAQEAALTGADPLVLLAMFDQEASLDPGAVGDHGTSFGLEMLHIGGALGSRTPAWALNPANAIRDAARRLAHAKTGADVAAIQRPADPAGYARSIDAKLARLRGAVRGAGASAGSANVAKWVTGKTSGLNPALLSGLAQIGEAVGHKVNVVSGKRSRAEQERLYQAFLNGTGNLAARPGTSNHESGNAADAYINGTALQSYPGAAAAAERAGIIFPVGGEPWHAESTGAVGVGATVDGSVALAAGGGRIGAALAGLLGKLGPAIGNGIVDGGGAAVDAAQDAAGAIGGVVTGAVNTAGRYVLTIVIVAIAGLLFIKGAERAVGSAVQGGE